MLYFKVTEICCGERGWRYYGATSLWRLLDALSAYGLNDIVEIKRVSRLPKGCEVFKVFA